eukprot:15352135-Ditylum_brightwellii.AAC.1
MGTVVRTKSVGSPFWITTFVIKTNRRQEAMPDDDSKAAEEQLSRREIARRTKPVVCYAVENLPPKQGGDALYESLRTAVKDGKATLVNSLKIPPRDARSWKVPAGHLWRIICTDGPQVADMNCWSESNPSE